MKKTLWGTLLFTFTFLLVFASAFSASAISTEKCIGESVDVSTFEELKYALENFSSGANIVLKNDISVTDDGKDCSIKITDYGAVTLDLNGYDIFVDSKATKYLFDVTGQARLYFVTRRSDMRSVIRFNTVAPGAATVRASHNFVEIHNVNVDFTMGSDAAYVSTTDNSDTAIFYIEKGSEMNIYKGIIHNGMNNGNGVVVAANEINKQKLSLNIGGYAEIEVWKYCVSFDPSNIRNVKFGSVRFESINSNTGLYERIKVPSGNSATLSDLWYTSQSGSGAAVYVGGMYTIQSRKVTDIKKADIIADKVCESLNNAEYFTLLQCAGGHIRICGTCFMAYNGVEQHTMRHQTGLAASCTTDGRTTGETCTVCSYSSTKIIPKKGHDMDYNPAVEVSCGVNGIKEHYFCNNCKGYFADAEGKTPIHQNEITIVNNHKITYLPERPATCTEEGLTSGVKCETCGKITEEQKVVPAKGHTVENITTPVSPTCSKEGRTAGEKCTVCLTVIEESVVIPKLEHTVKITEGYPATCTQPGLSYGEVCLVCGTVLKNREPIPAKGHTETVYEGKKATCKEEGLTDGLVCSDCGLVLKDREKIAKGAHVPENIKGKEASCKEEGLTNGSKCSVCDLVLEKQEKIPVTDNHKETLLKGVAASCTKEGLTDGSKCSVCDKVLSEQKVLEKLAHTHKVIKGTEATCLKEGLTDGIVCGVCDLVIEKQETVAKTPHSEKIVKGTAATCDKEGLSDGIICSLCETVLEKQEKLPALSHTEKIIKGFEADCEKEGLSDCVVCNTCGKVIKEQTVIPAKGHIISASVIRADFEKDGEITEICTVCKKQTKKELSKIASVKLSTTKYTYNGKAKTPSVTVKTAKGETLKKGTDFDVEYASGRKKIASYTVKVTFKGNYSGEKTLKFYVCPGVTEKVTVKQTANEISLSWEKVKGATGYRVYLYNEKTKKYKTLGTTDKTSCTVKKLKDGTTYKFAVKAYKKTEKGKIWALSSAKVTTATKPLTPSFTVKAAEGKASLSWKQVSGATGYVVYMSEKKDSGYKKLGSTDKLSCTVKNLKKGKTYYFKVKAYKKVDGKYVYSTVSKYKAVKIK